MHADADVAIEAIGAMASTADRLEITDYDLIVIGTGFVESLVARCCWFRPANAAVLPVIT